MFFPFQRDITGYHSGYYFQHQGCAHPNVFQKENMTDPTRAGYFIQYKGEIFESVNGWKSGEPPIIVEYALLAQLSKSCILKCALKCEHLAQNIPLVEHTPPHLYNVQVSKELLHRKNLITVVIWEDGFLTLHVLSLLFVHSAAVQIQPRPQLVFFALPSFRFW